MIIVRGLPHKAGQSAAHAQHSWEGVLLVCGRTIVVSWVASTSFFPAARDIDAPKTDRYVAAKRSAGAEVDVSDPIASEAWDACGDRSPKRAVQHLEAVLVEHERAAHEQAERLQEMRRETEAYGPCRIQWPSVWMLRSLT